MRTRERSYLVKKKAIKWAERAYKELNWDDNLDKELFNKMITGEPHGIHIPAEGERRIVGYQELWGIQNKKKEI